jgi:hypothetical protein
MLAFSNSNMPYLIVFPLKAGADAFNEKPETIEISLGHHVLLWHEWFDAAAPITMLVSLAVPVPVAARPSLHPSKSE